LAVSKNSCNFAAQSNKYKQNDTIRFLLLRLLLLCSKNVKQLAVVDWKLEKRKLNDISPASQKSDSGAFF
jgi:hypothetical protein